MTISSQFWVIFQIGISNFWSTWKTILEIWSTFTITEKLFDPLLTILSEGFSPFWSGSNWFVYLSHVPLQVDQNVAPLSPVFGSIKKLILKKLIFSNGFSPKVSSEIFETKKISNLIFGNWKNTGWILGKLLSEKIW